MDCKIIRSDLTGSLVLNLHSIRGCHFMYIKLHQILQKYTHAKNKYFTQTLIYESAN